MIHSFDDGFSVKSINRALNRGLNSPEEDPNSFSVVLDQESFQGVPKWNGRISDLPVSEKRAIKLFRNNRGLFTEESRWSLEGVALMSVCEKEGDYVWIGFFKEEPLGFYSFVPQTVVYMRLDEQFVSPQPTTKDGKLDHLKRTFSEKLLRQ